MLIPTLFLNLGGRIDTVDNRIDDLRNDMREQYQRLDDRMRTVEQRCAKIDQRLATLERAVTPAAEPAEQPQTTLTRAHRSRPPNGRATTA